MTSSKSCRAGAPGNERAASPEPPLAKARAPIPAGYRQGLISAITVLLGFSLLFMRYWNFEAPGVWSPVSIAAAIMTMAAIVLEFYSLWRSLRLEDDDPDEYRTTLRWFVVSIVVLVISLMFAQAAVSLKL